MKKIFSIIVLVLITQTGLFSQTSYIDNALKFSTNDYGGTARFIGMGGAFGALGGEFSSIAINPAGLGVYRSSELVFSPGMSYNSNKSIYINNIVDENGYAVNVGNMGFVVSNNLENTDTRWVNFNFGVGFNRTNDFNNNVYFQGVNNNSLLEVFVNEANNVGSSDPTNLDGMYEFLFWDAYIIDYDAGANEYYSEITDEVNFDPDNFEINQRKIIQTEGAVNEFTFSLGGNYAHKLYVGASVGLSRLKYSESASHFEEETSGLQIPIINSFDFREYSTIKGTGLTFKFGAIYKPFEFLRIGGSIHLPTFYSLDQEYYNSVTGNFTDSVKYSESPLGTYEYRLNTPLRAILSLGFQIGKIGLIDIDYEYVDYAKTKMGDEFDSKEVFDDNVEIGKIFQETHEIRVGLELRTGPIYYRAGGRYSTSPYESIMGNLNTDFEKITVAGGLGYRKKDYYIDIAFAQTYYEYEMIAYDYDPYNTAIASIASKINKFVLTFGMRF